MLTLSTKDNIPLGFFVGKEPKILRVTTNPSYPRPLRSSSALIWPDDHSSRPEGFGALLVHAGQERADRADCGALRLSSDLDYLDEGDVLKLSPDLRITTLYRKNANSNSLLLTERCNSFCLMCSQPPRDIDDSYIVQDVLRAIPLFDRQTKEVGLTGGEPTLLGGALFEIVGALKAHLPETAVHILSNGRNFSNIELARRVAALRHPDLMLGIPVYADVASIHDYVVQADGAFDETIRGILNLKRCGVRVEIRIVLHRATTGRLRSLATYIVRNLQFVDQVALMGLEITGFTKANLGELWIDPADYAEELADAVGILERGNVRARIYNHPLCVVRSHVRKYAVKSISDWKNEYMPECEPCQRKHECGGFFSSALLKRSSHIRPFLAGAGI